MTGRTMTGRILTRAGYLAVAAFILLGPAVYQIFGYKTYSLRTWRMYSGVGVGVLRGEFSLTRGAEEIARETPLQFFGRDRYVNVGLIDPTDLIWTEKDLTRLAEARCAELEPGVLLGFKGLRGTFTGWAPLTMTDICGGQE